MNYFLEPKKLKMLLLLILISINALFLLVGLFIFPKSWEYFVVPSLLPILWMTSLASVFGLNVVGGGNEFMETPNVQGTVLIIFGSIISLFIYYLIACAIVYFIDKKRTK